MLDNIFDEYVDICSEDIVLDLSKILLHPQASREKQLASPSVEDPRIPATPCIVFSEDIEEADFLHIKMDREKLFTVKNTVEGLVAVLSA
ncbi:hypothetical protein HPB50_023753 [Hyalomma asiaticum]|uniref:Uncharacterized protein n=1 Tax=Hyalomma asiaticum TaxID=266040 RepID=A0ACB7SK05_HYAAI|nr:hypothetical protein HPB50_023753 [Hyalomma asiaticum]